MLGHDAWRPNELWPQPVVVPVVAELWHRADALWRLGWIM